MSAHDDAQSNRREQRNQPSRLIRSRRLRWLGGRSRVGEQAEPSGQAGQQSSRGSQGGQGDAAPQVGASIPGIQPLEMAAADFGSLRAQHSSVRQRGSALVNQTEDVGWLYARIYCAGGDDTDALLPEIAQWLARACAGTTFGCGSRPSRASWTRPTRACASWGPSPDGPR